MGWSTIPVKLRQLRSSMLDAVRKLISDSPQRASVVIVGRQHYFDSQREMVEALGLTDGFRVLRLGILSDEDAKKIVRMYGGSYVPDWVPTRALLLSYLAARDFLKEVSGLISDLHSRGHGWDLLLRMICSREAQQHQALESTSVLHFVERLATIARRSNDGLGSFSEDELSSIFQQTCEFPPDDAARVLISRLPILARLEEDTGRRRFIDPDIADAACAGDVLRQIVSPFDSVVRANFVQAQKAMSGNGLDRLSYMVEKNNIASVILEVAAEAASTSDSPIVALDIVQLMIQWGVDYNRSPILISDFRFEYMSFDEQTCNLSRITFDDCVFHSLFISPESDFKVIPRFRNCLVGSLGGIVSRGDLPEDTFTNCEILDLVNSTARNSRILETDLPVGARVALTILNKLFLQAGRGRRENALYRGLDARERGLVPEILAIVSSMGFASPQKMRGQVVWMPNRDKAARVNEIVGHPSSSRDALIERIRNL